MRSLLVISDVCDGRLVLRHDSVGAVFASYGGQPTASDSDVILHFIRALAHNYAQIQVSYYDMNDI